MAWYAKDFLVFVEILNIISINFYFLYLWGALRGVVLCLHACGQLLALTYMKYQPGCRPAILRNSEGDTAGVEPE